MPSSRLSDYEIGPVLGVGTVGTIYLATEISTGERVAIKKLHPGVSQDELIRARFKREMTILERLRHPNIVAFYGGGEDGGLLYYVMEMVDGGTVKDMLQGSGPFSWQVVVDVTRQICSALQCAHNHGVIHRDLKPGNLFLTQEAQVKLGDFGIARDVTSSDLTTEGFTVGTHAYMSPEQITGDAMISGKADLYALGCCVFEMLSGRKPFLGENFAQLFEQHLRVPPPHINTLVGDCPGELDEIVCQLLAKRPEDRPFNARQVQGVMCEIGEKYGLGEAENSHGTSKDVAAEKVTEKGRQMLSRQIKVRLGGNERAEVSWSKVAVLMGVILGITAIVMLMGRS